MKKKLLCTIFAMILAMMSAFPAMAYSAQDFDSYTGPSFGVESPYAKDKTLPNSRSITVGEDQVEYGERGALIGEFKTTGYCNCSLCCGEWAGSKTASGVYPTAKHTVAADTSVLPMGTKIMIGDSNIVYTVEDVGGSVYGNVVDIYYADHASADGHGVQYFNIYYVK